MNWRLVISALGATCASAIVGAACAADRPTESSNRSDHDHTVAFKAGNTSPEIAKKIAELRRWSAPFHNLTKAVEAGYTHSIGCIDETLAGVDPTEARGMGYHLGMGPDGFGLVDGVVDIDQPEFLVYAPHQRDADLPPEERFRNARLVGFDYFVPGALWEHPEPPEFFGEAFNWSEVFQGWMRHIYLWGHNPDGIFEDFNAHVALCTDLLVGGPAIP